MTDPAIATAAAARSAVRGSAAGEVNVRSAITNSANGAATRGPKRRPAGGAGRWRLAALLAVCAAGLGMIGCATVAPYEREALSRRPMRTDADPEGDAVRAHVAGAREAALDPGASGGGGCGCN